MLDPKLIRETPDAVEAATRVTRDGSPDLVERWLDGAEGRRSAQTQADRLKSDQREAGERMKQKLSAEDRSALQARLREIKEQVQSLEEAQKTSEAEAHEIMLQLPAIPDPSWPVG